MLSELPLARIVTVGIEYTGLPRGGSKAAGDGTIAVARMADIDRRSWHAGADADRHQHRLDPVVAEAVRPAGFVQHHVLRPQSRLDHLVVPRPANGQHAFEHQEMFDHFMEMTRGIFADRLVHEAQRELPRSERAWIVGLGRAAGADIAHLSPL